MTVKKRAPSADIVTLATPPIPLAAGETFAEQYTIEQLYGSGPLGFTYRGRDAAGSAVAIKVVARVLAPTDKERQNIVQEVGKLVDREMPRVAVPIDVGVASNVVYVATPWIKGRSLRRVLAAYRDAARVMPYEEVLGVIEGTVQALRQLHTVASHGALYPESVQIASDGRIILTDAGVASAVSRARLVEYFETFPDVYPYLSPEIRAGKPSSAGSDLYSLGALASELLTGDAAAAAAGITGPILKKLPPEIDQALQGLVANKPSKRAGALPVLLGGLAKAIGARSLPVSATLPVPRGRTDVMPTPASIAHKRTRRQRDA